MLKSVLLVTAQPENVEPPPGVAHFKPVASALSATKPAILQEQSQRIVLDKRIIPNVDC